MQQNILPLIDRNQYQLDKRSPIVDQAIDEINHKIENFSLDDIKHTGEDLTNNTQFDNSTEDYQTNEENPATLDMFIPDEADLQEIDKHYDNTNTHEDQHASETTSDISDQVDPNIEEDLDDDFNDDDF